MEVLAGDTKKIRKRGCSPSSSTSSVIQNYKFKRGILVGKGGSRGGSSTPVPTWRMVGSRSPSVVLRATVGASPRNPPGQAPVSARKLAATLWEMNEVPSPSPRIPPAGRRRKEKAGRSVCSGFGSLPPHLSDPSHSPVSERMQQSGTGTHRRRESSISRRLTIDNFDSTSNASFMEVETRSRCETPCESTVGSKTRLRDVTNALTTSKELLKIITRMWGHQGQPSSSSSLMSALFAELERARFQVSHLIQEERSEADHREINYLIKRFAEEKTAWKNKEQEIVEAAVESIAGELEVERKLRRRFESLNKKLGKELAETKAAFLKVVKELESEKRARVIIEQVCDELARNIGEDKAQAAEVERESLRIQDEIQKEREMLQIADLLREERAQMKISDAKHHFEEKNAAVDKIKNELEAFIRSKNSSRENGSESVYARRDVDLVFCQSEARGSDMNEDDGEICVENEAHSIEMNKDESKKKYKVGYLEQKGRKSILNQVARRSTSLLRSMSNVVEWGNSSKYEHDKQVPRRSCGDELIQKHKSAKGLREHALPTSRLRVGVEGEYNASPSSRQGHPWPSEMRVEEHNSRRSRR